MDCALSASRAPWPDRYILLQDVQLFGQIKDARLGLRRGFGTRVTGGGQGASQRHTPATFYSRPMKKGDRRRPLALHRSTSLSGVVASDQGPRVQPNKASSKDERLPDLRAIVAATTLQSRARESLLASLARRQASVWASPPKSEMSASASEEIASRSSCGR